MTNIGKRPPGWVPDGRSNVVQLIRPERARFTYRPSPAQLIRRDQAALADSRGRARTLGPPGALSAASDLERAALASIEAARSADANTAIALSGRSAHLIARAFVYREEAAR